LIDDANGQVHYSKVLTTHHALAEGVTQGIDKVLAQAGGLKLGARDTIVHGTTIGTNALIERTGARTGLITTQGFRDVLEIARIERPDGGLYDIFVDLPTPLVPRMRRMEVAERIGADGAVVRQMEDQSVIDAVTALKQQNVESIAVALIFSFRNPAHEKRVREICEEVFPEASVSISAEIAPEFREYERTSTTVINAYLQPVATRYLDNLGDRLHDCYGEVDLHIMQANGGSMTPAMARTHTVNLVNSGPAGGALAAAYIGRLTGDEKIVSVDMGGTSFDIGLIDGGKPRITQESMVEGFPVKVPMLDVHAIGAGGGSIAWVDAGGALNVGPESARSNPGPACYGRGGDRPAVTDANLVLGRLNPDYFLGGEMKLDVERARTAIKTHVADPLGMSVEEAASGIIRVVNANMVRGISTSSVKRGYDVREFSLLPYGGAGPLHAVELAQDMDMRRVIVPPYPGTFSALGVLVADTRYDYVATLARSESEITPEEFEAGLVALEARGRQQLTAQHVAESDMLIEWSADLRYQGQSYELNIPVARKDSLTQADIQEVIKHFHELHYQVYAYGSVDETVEFINLRLAAIGKVPEVHMAARQDNLGSKASQSGTRNVYFPELGFLESAIYRRESLQAGQHLSGPCLVEELASTTVIPPTASAEIDVSGNLIIDWERSEQ
jgi:N-methylhydantoinase A